MTKVTRPVPRIEAAAQGDAVVVPTARASTSMAALLSGHILQDGEVVLMILKPSLWFVLISGLKFIAGVLILMISAALMSDKLPGHPRTYQEFGAFVVAGRVMWAALQWMGRLYILTDLRIIRLSGVLTVNIFDCPLRKIARTRLLRPMRERLLRLGTIEIIPGDESCPIAYWNTISRPLTVHDQVVAAINRSKQGPMSACR